MPASAESVDLARAAARAAEDKIATSITAIDVTDQLAIAEIFLICSAASDRQVGAVVDAVEDAMREHGVRRIRREGEREGRWVLIDYGDIVVHVQHDEEKDFYELERLWRDCPAIDLRLTGAGAQGEGPSGDHSGA